MITYRLRCGEGHEYDSMFNNSGTFDTLKAAGELACEVCGDRRVEKGIMAPAIRTGERGQRIADLDAVEGHAVSIVPNVGDLAACLQAADEGDPVARKLLRGPVTGSYNEEDLPMLKERGTFIDGPNADNAEAKDAPEAKRTMHAVKGKRPSASTKVKTPGKKAPKKNLN